MAAAASPAVDRAAAAKVVDRAAVAVRVVADHPVDSVVAVEAVETADASLSYLKREVSGPTAHLFYLCVLLPLVAKSDCCYLPFTITFSPSGGWTRAVGFVEVFLEPPIDFLIPVTTVLAF